MPQTMGVTGLTAIHVLTFSWTSNIPLAYKYRISLSPLSPRKTSLKQTLRPCVPLRHLSLNVTHPSLKKDSHMADQIIQDAGENTTPIVVPQQEEIFTRLTTFIAGLREVSPLFEEVISNGNDADKAKDDDLLLEDDEETYEDDDETYEDEDETKSKDEGPMCLTVADSLEKLLQQFKSRAAKYTPGKKLAPFHRILQDIDHNLRGVDTMLLCVWITAEDHLSERVRQVCAGVGVTDAVEAIVKEMEGLSEHDEAAEQKAEQMFARLAEVFAPYPEAYADFTRLNDLNMLLPKLADMPEDVRELRDLMLLARQPVN